MIGIICMDMYMNKFLKIFFIYKMNIILLFSILIILLGAVFLFYLFVLQPNQNNNDCTGDNCKKNPPSPTNSKDCSPKCINNQTCINGTCQNKYNCLNQNCDHEKHNSKWVENNLVSLKKINNLSDLILLSTYYHC